MHTSGSPRSAHSRCTCSHRGPVGSHATVTDANPLALACPAAQSSASPSRNAFTRTVSRGSIPRSCSRRAFRLRSPRVMPLPLLTGRPLWLRLGHQARTIAPGGRPRLSYLRQNTRLPRFALLLRAITGGVDTHADVHVAAALDPIGGLLLSRSYHIARGASALTRFPPAIPAWRHPLFSLGRSAARG